MRAIWLAIMILFVTAFAGCQMGDRTDDETGMRDPNVERTRFQDDNDRTIRDNVQKRDQTGDRYGMTRRDSRGTADPHQDDKRDNRSYDIHKEAAERIVNEVSEIDYAYVLTNNRNAYVAAVLDKDNQSTSNKDRDQQSTTNDNRDGSATNDYTNRNQTISDGMTNRGNDDGHELTDDVKKEIKQIVKSVDKNIDNVYVSTNPDFADLTTNYVNDFNDGRPVRGMFDQLGNMIERIFPQNRR